MVAEKSKTEVMEILGSIKDPEIPVLAITDLGIVTDINLTKARNAVEVVITPTFVGCPAIEMIRSEISEKLLAAGFEEVKVTVSFETPWTSDKITQAGRQALKSFGLAPPPVLISDLEILPLATCPRCQGTDTELRSLFGPTQCRSIFYCFKCMESFEQFKPL